MTVLRRGLGLLVLAFSTLPIYRLLDISEDAPHRRASVEMAESTLALIGWGTAVTLLIAVVLAFFLPTGRIRLEAAGLARRIERIPLRFWASGLAVVSFTLALTAKLGLYGGLFTNVDEIASTIQARYLAAAALGGPVGDLGEAWLIPNMLIVGDGWVSHFPVGHLWLMAGFERLGAPELLGPFLFALMVGMTALSLPRLLPERPGTARLAALAVSVSPFLVLLGAGALSHTSAGAAGATALWAALKARDGHWSWSILAGAAVGLMVGSRPWSGMVLGTIATLGVWLPGSVAKARAGWLLTRALGTGAGGAPFAAALFWFNHRLFGGPFTLGYLAAFGDRHRLGFHPDPWGYEYSALEALGFTSTDVLSAGLQLLETPVPAGIAVGLFLVLSPKLLDGIRLLLAWALIPVVANAYYWFHDARMLYEAAPAWITLGVFAAVFLAGGFGADPEDVSPRRSIRPADVGLWAAVVAAVVAAVGNVPTRIGSHEWSQETLDRVTLPELPTADPALVFVHASWNERLSSTLQAAGSMRQDSVISTLRRNTNCGLQLYAEAREAAVRSGLPPTGLPSVDLEQLPGTPAGIERPPAPEGTTLRMRAGEHFPPTCIRQLRADRFGAVALAPLLWQGDLPGLETGAPMFVRDLGPERNQRVIARYGDRTPWVFVPRADGQPPEIVSYAEAMRVLWQPPPTSPGVP